MYSYAQHRPHDVSTGSWWFRNETLRQTVILTCAQNTQNTKHILILYSAHSRTDINELGNDRFAFHSSSLFKHAFTGVAPRTHVTKCDNFFTQFLISISKKINLCKNVTGETIITISLVILEVVYAKKNRKMHCTLLEKWPSSGVPSHDPAFWNGPNIFRFRHVLFRFPLLNCGT